MGVNDDPSSPRTCGPAPASWPVTSVLVTGEVGDLILLCATKGNVSTPTKAITTKLHRAIAIRHLLPPPVRTTLTSWSASRPPAADGATQSSGRDAFWQPHGRTRYPGRDWWAR